MSVDRTGKNHPLYGKTHSEETRKKLSAANKENLQKIEVFDEKNKITTIYNSMSEAAKALNIKHTIISIFISNNQKKPYKGLYRFKKI